MNDFINWCVTGLVDSFSFLTYHTFILEQPLLLPYDTTLSFYSFICRVFAGGLEGCPRLTVWAVEECVKNESRYFWHNFTSASKVHLGLKKKKKKVQKASRKSSNTVGRKSNFI